MKFVFISNFLVKFVSFLWSDRKSCIFFWDLLVKDMFSCNPIKKFGYLLNKPNFEEFYSRSFVKFTFFLQCFWWNLHFFKKFLMKFVIFLWTYDEICFIHNLLIKNAFYSLSLDKKFGLFEILWQNVHFIHNSLAKFDFYSQFFGESSVFWDLLRRKWFFR